MPQPEEISVIPEKSKKKYLYAYETFKKWQTQNKLTSATEDVLLRYFKELATKRKPSSLWSYYSMLKTTLFLYENTSIGKYRKLLNHLNSIFKSFRQNHKKAQKFVPHEIKNFINIAPDWKYFPTKVALVLAVTGGCGPSDCHKLKLDAFKDHGTFYEVNVPKLKKFYISHPFYNICKQYLSNRPEGADVYAFHYIEKGKVVKMKISNRVLSKMASDIAEFLKLPDPETYTGVSLRKSFTTYFDHPDDQSITWIPSLSQSAAKDFGDIEPRRSKRQISKSSDNKQVNDTNILQRPQSFNFNIDDLPDVVFNRCKNIKINILFS